jgi:hypothetical protein
MSRIALQSIIAVAVAFGAAIGAAPSWADCGCGPLYCKIDPTFPAAFAKKKAALSHAGYPNRLIALLDKGGQCLVCVGNGSPDVFTLLPPTKNAQGQVVLNPVPWDEDNERIANDHLRSEEIKSYYIYNTRKACTCCGEPKAEDRDDYDADLDLNRGTSLKCVKGDGGHIVCN